MTLNAAAFVLALLLGALFPFIPATGVLVIGATIAALAWKASL
jgi:hypothetical protein